MQVLGVHVVVWVCVDVCRCVVGVEGGVCAGMGCLVWVVVLGYVQVCVLGVDMVRVGVWCVVCRCVVCRRVGSCMGACRCIGYRRGYMGCCTCAGIECRHG